MCGAKEMDMSDVTVEELLLLCFWKSRQDRVLLSDAWQYGARLERRLCRRIERGVGALQSRALLCCRVEGEWAVLTCDRGVLVGIVESMGGVLWGVNQEAWVC